MIKRISHGLLFSGLVLSSCALAALPDNVQLQRDTLRSMTLTLQLQAEGIYALQHKELQQDVQRLQRLLTHAGHSHNGYPETLKLILRAVEQGHPPTTEDMDRLHGQAITFINSWHNPDTDTPYLPLLTMEYLAMRYAFSSYIGNPSPNSHEPGRYYTTDTHELLPRLDHHLADMLAGSGDNSLSARWTMLHHALSDTHEGWTRTRSGNAFAPIVLIRNARAFGDQLSQMLDTPDTAVEQ